MFALTHCSGTDVSMQMVRRRAKDGIDSLFLLKHDAEIFVIGDLVIWRLFRKMLFDFGFQRQPARDAIEIKRMQVLVLDWIGHRHNLSVSLVKKPAHIDLALPAASDNSDVDFVAWRNEFWPAKNMPWHHGDSCHGRCSRRQEFAPVLRSRGRRFLGGWVHI